MRGVLPNLVSTGWASARSVVQRRMWRSSGSSHEDVAVELLLRDLGLDVPKLSPESRATLRHHIAAAGESIGELHYQRSVAMHFFTRHVIEEPDTTPLTGNLETTLNNAIAIIVSWCRTNSALAKVAGPEVHRLSAYLYFLKTG